MGDSIWRLWIKRKGVQEVAFLLNVNQETVRGWVNYGKNPKDEHKKRLVALSGNEFGYADFFTDMK
jgi:hypothetical protein